jgi:hypothetical protein
MIEAMGERESKNPVEHALDLCLFAPLGFALEARSLLPRFVDRGRNQVVLARVVGKYAVRKGTAAAEMALTQAQEHAMGLLRLTGVVEGDSTVPGPASGNGHEPGARVAPSSPTDPAPSANRPEPPFPADQLAIPDYDSLSASQVVPRLDGLTAAELEAVREYESATRRRKTILNKVGQLQSP